jgi:hypothetical protein
MSQSQPLPLCECCNEPNSWVLLDPVYEFICGTCAEEGAITGLCEYTGTYQMLQPCVGCGKVGPANMKDSGAYYCGGGPRCCP